MALVAYGYALEAPVNTGIGGGDLVIALLAEPEIVIEPDVDISFAADPVTISVEPDIEIEVE